MKSPLSEGTDPILTSSLKLKRSSNALSKSPDHIADDGVDDDECEDEYIMKSCFSTKDDKIIVRIFYGDVTEEIGYVSVSN